MRIALAQTNILWEDKQANLVRAEEFVIAADAEIVLFPEMSLTGFSMHTDVTAEICQPDAEIQSRAQMDSTPDMTNQPTTGKRNSGLPVCGLSGKRQDQIHSGDL